VDGANVGPLNLLQQQEGGVEELDHVLGPGHKPALVVLEGGDGLYEGVEEPIRGPTLADDPGGGVLEHAI
jgi:hypothetical protein